MRFDYEGLETKKTSGEAMIKIEPDLKPLKKSKECANGTCKCSCCGKVYPVHKKHFTTTNSPLYKGNNMFLTICRDCLDNYYTQLVKYYSGDEEKAIERCCQIFDWYYSEEAVSMTRNHTLDRTRLSAYISKMSLAQIKNRGTTYLDTVTRKMEENETNREYVNKLMGTPSAEEGEDSEPIDTDEEAAILESAVEVFGTGYTKEEYSFLEKQYKEWALRGGGDSKSHEETYKIIALQQLNVRRAQKSGSSKELVEAMKALQDSMTFANLKPTQTTGAYGENTPIGVRIKMSENQEPVGEAKPEWRDVDGIGKIVETFFLGHLYNLAHIKNEKEDEYRAEMAKYTVSPPEYENEELAETSILDRLSNKGEPK
jgi:hypothetical protein